MNCYGRRTKDEGWLPDFRPSSDFLYGELLPNLSHIQFSIHLEDHLASLLMSGEELLKRGQHWLVAGVARLGHVG